MRATRGAIMMIELISMSATTTIDERYVFFHLLLMTPRRRSFGFLFARDGTLASNPLSIGSGLYVNGSRLTMDAMMNFWYIMVRVIALYVLPGVAFFTKNCVAVVVGKVADTPNYRVIVFDGRFRRL
jgi:hypothetical protein